jgi:RNA ligase
MYRFPTIEHISEVRTATRGRDEFKECVKNGYTVFNYMVVGPDTFPPVMGWEAAVLRECRGLIFDTESGKVIRRPFHKFFNVGEREETQPNKLSLETDHCILEKLDGSMVTPLRVEDTIRWATKMGVTDTAMSAERHVAKHRRYHDFARYMIERNWTPIFEWCSRYDRIVVEYQVDRLVFTGARQNITGEYLEYEHMLVMAKEWDLDVVKATLFTNGENIVKDLSDILARTKGLTDSEGFIIRWHDGHMVKMKSDWYLTLHGAKDAISHEKNVIRFIFENKLDDVRPSLMENDLRRLDSFQTQVLTGFHNKVERVQNLLADSTKRFDRKTFALDVAPKLDKVTRNAIFACWEGRRDVADVIRDHILDSCGSATKVDQIRGVWGNHRWKEARID